MPLASINGIDIYHEVAGAGHPVVFVHGHALDSRMWQKQVAPLARFYTVVRYDIRGHGRSAAPRGGYSRAHLTEEVTGLIDHLGLTRPSLVGHSLGGGIALEYALRRPDRVCTLTLLASGLEGLGSSGHLSGSVAKQRALLRKEGVSKKFLRAALTSQLFDGVRQSPEILALARQMLSGWSGASWLDDTEYPQPALRHIERLGELRVPVLVAVGERDMPGFHDAAEALTRGILVVRKSVVPEAGHLAPLEKPEAFNDILLDFLGGAAGKALI